MERTVAVTGGSGKLGRAVVAALGEQGWQVVNFDRVPSSRSDVRCIRTVWVPETLRTSVDLLVRRRLSSSMISRWR